MILLGIEFKNRTFWTCFELLLISPRGAQESVRPCFSSAAQLFSIILNLLTPPVSRVNFSVPFGLFPEMDCPVAFLFPSRHQPDLLTPDITTIPSGPSAADMPNDLMEALAKYHNLPPKVMVTLAYENW